MSAFRTHGRRRAGAAALVAALACALLACGCGDAPHRRPAPRRDWPRFGGDADGTRYSPLRQIGLGNVDRLRRAWSLPEGPRLSLWETFPVVVGRTMYITTNTDQVLALDAASGRRLWTYTPRVDFSSAVGDVGQLPVSRGVTVAAGRVFLVTFDDRLIALGAGDGRELWRQRFADPRAGLWAPSPPAYWRGRLFVGGAANASGLRGFVAAYDSSTGRELWRRHTVPAPGRQWMASRGTGGGDVWMPPTVDSATGTVYVGTGNPTPAMSARARPGCDPWVDATVALDARTGRRRWARTQVCPDLWDYDSAQPPLLFDHRGPGGGRRAVGQGNKAGVYWIFDAASGATLATSRPLVPQSRPRRAPSRHGTRVCPGAFGGIQYSPAAFSPRTRLIYVPLVRECTIYRAGPATGTLGGRLALARRPRPSGDLVALDADTAAVRWRQRLAAPLVGGALATAGDLVFTGADDGRLYAFDARTGRIVWHADVGLAFGSAPIAYEVDGVEYVAVAAGGSSVALLDGAPIGGRLVVFRLPPSAR